MDWPWLQPRTTSWCTLFLIANLSIAPCVHVETAPPWKLIAKSAKQSTAKEAPWALCNGAEKSRCTAAAASGPSNFKRVLAGWWKPLKGPEFGTCSNKCVAGTYPMLTMAPSREVGQTDPSRGLCGLKMTTFPNIYIYIFIYLTKLLVNSWTLLSFWQLVEI